MKKLDNSLTLDYILEMDRRPLFMLSTELHRRTSLIPDGRPEKGGETPGRTTSKVLEF